jgi:hypothetical protein
MVITVTFEMRISAILRVYLVMRFSSPGSIFSFKLARMLGIRLGLTRKGARESAKGGCRSLEMNSAAWGLIVARWPAVSDGLDPIAVKELKTIKFKMICCALPDLNISKGHLLFMTLRR